MDKIFLVKEKDCKFEGCDHWRHRETRVELTPQEVELLKFSVSDWLTLNGQKEHEVENLLKKLEMVK